MLGAGGHLGRNSPGIGARQAGSLLTKPLAQSKERMGWDAHPHQEHNIQAHTEQLRHVCLVQPKGAWTRWPVPTRGQTAAPLEQPRRPRLRPAGAGAAHPLTQSRSQFRSQLRLSARPASRAGLLLLPHLVLGLTPPRGYPWGPGFQRTQSRAPHPCPAPPGGPHRAGHAHRSPSPGCSRRSCRPSCPLRRDRPRSQTGRPAFWCHPLCGQGERLTAWPPGGRRRPQTQPEPPAHLLPFSEGFLEKEALSLLEAWGTQWLFPMGGGGAAAAGRESRATGLGRWVLSLLPPPPGAGLAASAWCPNTGRGWSLSGRTAPTWAQPSSPQPWVLW